MDILSLLDELQAIGQGGLEDAESPYDRKRNERILELVSEYYGKSVELPPDEIRERLAEDVGYPTAKVGASTTVFNDNGQILLIKRADSKKWGLPAGAVDPNESAQEAAVRETKEETGLEVEIAKLLNVYSELPSDRNPHTVVMVSYMGEITGGAPRTSHESEAVSYWDIEEVPVWHPPADARIKRARNAHEIWLTNSRES